MQCSDIQLRLTGARYGETPLNDAERAHVESCASCRTAAAAADAVDAALATDVDTTPGLGFDTRFLARLEEAKAEKSQGLLSRWRWGLVGTGALAAGAAALFLFVASNQPPAFGADLELAMQLELMQDLELVQNLEDVEVYDLLARVDDADLEALLGQAEGQP